MRIGNLSRTRFAASAATGLLLAATAPANAFVIDGTTAVGDQFLTSFLLSPGQTDNGGNTLGGTVDLTASVTYTVFSLDFLQSDLVFDIKIHNTTDGFDERILAFGFNTSPSITVTSFSGGSVFDGYSEGKTFPSFQKVEFCAFADDPCSGGSFQNGLQAGQFDTVRVGLSWAGDPLNVDPSMVKFQGDLGSYQLEGYCEGDECTPPTTVPEPASLSLLGLGLIGLYTVRRRRSFRGA